MNPTTSLFHQSASALSLCLLSISLILSCGIPPEEKEQGSSALTSGSGTLPATAAGALTTGEASAVFGQAIEAYLDAVSKKGAPVTDTLFVGNQMDYPGLTAPATSRAIPIELLQPAVVQQRLAGKQQFVFINAAGWFDAENTEFIFVNFREGWKPQHNCHLYFARSAESPSFVLDSLSFEYPYGLGK